MNKNDIKKVYKKKSIRLGAPINFSFYLTQYQAYLGNMARKKI